MLTPASSIAELMAKAPADAIGVKLSTPRRGCSGAHIRSIMSPKRFPFDEKIETPGGSAVHRWRFRPLSGRLHHGLGRRRIFSRLRLQQSQRHRQLRLRGELYRLGQALKNHIGAGRQRRASLGIFFEMARFLPPENIGRKWQPRSGRSGQFACDFAAFGGKAETADAKGWRQRHIVIGHRRIQRETAAGHRAADTPHAMRSVAAGQGIGPGNIQRLKAVLFNGLLPEMLPPPWA